MLSVGKRRGFSITRTPDAASIAVVGRPPFATGESGATSNTPYASPYALEMFYPRAPGTGSPAIPSTHRIFRAYPGIEYNIRAAVRGGSYPYNFSLTNAPSGMTVNSRTGEISWPNPTADATPTLTCTDSIGATVSGTWTITVSTSGFYFLDGNYSGTSTGSITQPFKTLIELVAGTNGTPTGIAYIRQSSTPYTFTNYPTAPTKESLDGQGDGSLYFNCANAITPAVRAVETLLAYPGEAPVIDCEERRFLRSDRPYLDGLTFLDGREYMWKTSGGSHYKTVRRCTFRGVRPATTTNRNQGFMFAISEGTGNYFVIQDNDWSEFVGAQAIGSLYHCDDVLIEDNRTHDGGTTLPGNFFCTPLGLKESCSRATIRGNDFEIPAGAVYVEMFNEFGGDSMDFSYNKIIGGASQVVFRFTDYSFNGARVFRNTIRGSVNFGSGLNHVNSLFDRNVVEGALTNTGAMAQGDNVTGAYGSGIVDSSGDLTPAYAAYLGTHGAQVS